MQRALTKPQIEEAAERGALHGDELRVALWELAELRKYVHPASLQGAQATAEGKVRNRTLGGSISDRRNREEETR